MNTVLAPRKRDFFTEAGGWLSFERRQTNLDDKPPMELLRLAAQRLDGNLRYAIIQTGVVLLGEMRLVEGEFASSQAQQELKRMSRSRPLEDAPLPSEEALESALAQTSVQWSRREAAWHVSLPEENVPDLSIRLAPRHARVETELVSWPQELDEVRSLALATFFCSAHAKLRFAQCQMDERSARLVSQTSVGRLETELSDSIGSVAAAARSLSRGASALLVPELAQAYLESQQHCFKRELTHSAKGQTPFETQPQQDSLEFGGRSAVFRPTIVDP